MKDRFVKTYDRRWKNASLNGDDDILCFSNPCTQVELFYKLYCKFIEDNIKTYFKGVDIKSLNLLEIGCGRGTASVYLSKTLGLNAYGIDFSNESIKIAKKNSLKYDSCAKFFKGDIFEHNEILINSNLKNCKFDIIISLGVLEHIENIEDCFKNHRELINQNGLFIAMIVPEKKSIQDYFGFLNRVCNKFDNFTNKSHRLIHLDKKTLSKTADVYRSFKDHNYYASKLKSSGFFDVSTVQSNPFPTIRPINKSFEKLLTFFYVKIIKIFQILLSKNIFFNSPISLSRCHFLKGYAK